MNFINEINNENYHTAVTEIQCIENVSINQLSLSIVLKWPYD